VTPVQRHDGRDASILSYREQVYEAAKERHPERWTGNARNWELGDEVWLNPERKQTEEFATGFFGDLESPGHPVPDWRSRTRYKVGPCGSPGRDSAFCGDETGS